MGQFDFVVSPVSPEEPCGPDLEGQNDFDNALASLEGRFPQSYLKFSNPPKVSNPSEMTELAAGFDLTAELTPFITLLKRSRDIRLLVPAAKLSILAGDVGRFAEIVTAITALLANNWEDVHPRAFEGSFAIRESHLSLLDDGPTVNMPLQEKPFITLRRLGPVSFRTQLLASKAVIPRDKEVGIDEAPLREALVKSDDFADIKAVYAQINGTFEALKQIRAIFIQHAGGQNAPSFDRLNAILTSFSTFLQSLIEVREPSAAAPTSTSDDGEDATPSLASDDAGAALPATPPKGIVIKTPSEAAAILKSVETYFRLSEPSNPATLLVRQAQQLVGKSFIEAMTVLNPQLAEKAAIRIGGEMQLIISSKQMSALAQESAAETGAPETPPPPAVTSRLEASTAMEAVEKFYQRNEPSSPIPLLLNRARTYAGKDFATLMKEIGPSG